LSLKNPGSNPGNGKKKKKKKKKKEIKKEIKKEEVIIFSFFILFLYQACGLSEFQIRSYY
jgi:hypothetical protein